MAQFGIEELVLYAVFVIGTALSLFQYFHIRRLSGSGNASVEKLRTDPLFSEVTSNGPVILGIIDLNDLPDINAMLDLLALHLENPARLMQSSWKKTGETGTITITRRSDRIIEFTGKRVHINQGIVRIVEISPGRFQAHWALDVPGANLLLWVGKLWALCLGFPISIVVPFAIAYYMQRYVSVRSQALQVVQVTQVLWEPFLFSGIARQRIKSAGSYLEELIAASAYEVRTGRAAFSTSP